MSVPAVALRKTAEAARTYWVLVRVIVPVTVLTEALSRMGAIEAVAPAFAPVMNLVGLPPEMGLAWLTGMLVGIWAAVPLIFTLVPVSSLSAADMTVFSALVLFAHALPIEQKIIQMAGPGMIVTTLLRVAGGLTYAWLLHHVLAATGWLSAPVDPAWIPMSATPGWTEFFLGLAETMAWMFVILVVLSWGLEILKATGILGLVMKAFSPVLRLCGIHGEAEHLTAVGLFLGILVRGRPAHPRGTVGLDTGAPGLPVMRLHGFRAFCDRGHAARHGARRGFLGCSRRTARLRRGDDSGDRRPAPPHIRRAVLRLGIPERAGREPLAVHKKGRGVAAPAFSFPAMPASAYAARSRRTVCRMPPLLM